MEKYKTYLQFAGAIFFGAILGATIFSFCTPAVTKGPMPDYPASPIP